MRTRQWKRQRQRRRQWLSAPPLLVDALLRRDTRGLRGSQLRLGRFGGAGGGVGALGIFEGAPEGRQGKALQGPR